MASMMLSLLGMIGGIWSEKFDHIAAFTNFVVTPLDLPVRHLLFGRPAAADLLVAGALQPVLLHDRRLPLRLHRPVRRHAGDRRRGHARGSTCGAGVLLLRMLSGGLQAEGLRRPMPGARAAPPRRSGGSCGWAPGRCSSANSGATSRKRWKPSWPPPSRRWSISSSWSSPSAPSRGTAEGDALLSHAVPGLVLMAVLFRSRRDHRVQPAVRPDGGHHQRRPDGPAGRRRDDAPPMPWPERSAVWSTGGVVLAGAMLAWPMPPVQPWALPVFAALSALMMSLAGMLIGLYCEQVGQSRGRLRSSS